MFSRKDNSGFSMTLVELSFCRLLGTSKIRNTPDVIGVSVMKAL